MLHLRTYTNKNYVYYLKNENYIFLKIEKIFRQTKHTNKQFVGDLPKFKGIQGQGELFGYKIEKTSYFGDCSFLDRME